MLRFSVQSIKEAAIPIGFTVYAELYELYLHRDVVGGFDSDSDYWSSTEYVGFRAWPQYFGYIDQQRFYFKSAPPYVRAIRNF